MTRMNTLEAPAAGGRRIAALAFLGVGLLAGCSTPTLSPQSKPTLLVPGRTAEISAATQATDTPDTLQAWSPSLDEAIRRAIACSGEINALDAAISVAEQQRLAATDIVDPELSFGTGRSGDKSTRNRLENRDSTSQSTENQRTRGTRVEEQNTVDDYGLPQSTSSGLQQDTSSSRSTSQGTETQSARTSGYAMDSESDWQVGARFFIPNPWLVGPHIEACKAEIEAARADWRAATQVVAGEVRRLYATVSHLTDEVATAGELLRLDGIVLKTMQERSAQGTATAADLLTAARRHLQTQDGLEKARYSLKVEQRALAALLNVSPGVLRIPTNIPPVNVLPEAEIPFDRATALAMQHRSELAALQWRIVAAKAAYREARNVRLPWIKEINLGYSRSHERSWGEDITTGTRYGTQTTTQSSTGSGQTRETKTGSDGTGAQTAGWFQESEQGKSTRTSSSSENGFSSTSDRKTGDEWWVGFAVDIPIFSLTRNRESDVLLAECRLADVNMAEGQRLIRSELRTALDELEDSRQQQARYAKEVAPIIDGMRKVLETLKEASDSMPDQVAATEMQIVESARLERNARHRYKLALLSLEQAIGAPLSVDSQP
jgi:outer membrane protein TolC